MMMLFDYTYPCDKQVLRGLTFSYPAIHIMEYLWRGSLITTGASMVHYFSRTLLMKTMLDLFPIKGLVVYIQETKKAIVK